MQIIQDNVGGAHPINPSLPEEQKLKFSENEALLPQGGNIETCPSFQPSELGPKNATSTLS